MTKQIPNVRRQRLVLIWVEVKTDFYSPIWEQQIACEPTSSWLPAGTRGHSASSALSHFLKATYEIPHAVHFPHGDSFLSWKQVWQTDDGICMPHDVAASDQRRVMRHCLSRLAVCSLRCGFIAAPRYCSFPVTARIRAVTALTMRGGRTNEVTLKLTWKVFFFFSLFWFSFFFFFNLHILFF